MNNEYLEYFNELANTNIKDLRINAINDKCEVYKDIIEEIKDLPFKIGMQYEN